MAPRPALHDRLSQLFALDAREFVDIGSYRAPNDERRAAGAKFHEAATPRCDCFFSST